MDPSHPSTESVVCLPKLNPLPFPCALRVSRTPHLWNTSVLSIRYITSRSILHASLSLDVCPRTLKSFCRLSLSVMKSTEDQSKSGVISCTQSMRGANGAISIRRWFWSLCKLFSSGGTKNGGVGSNHRRGEPTPLQLLRPLKPGWR